MYRCFFSDPDSNQGSYIAFSCHSSLVSRRLPWLFCLLDNVIFEPIRLAVLQNLNLSDNLPMILNTSSKDTTRDVLSAPCEEVQNPSLSIRW